MDRQIIQDRAMVERYLQGRLTADEQQAFEEAYLSDPGLLDELELTEKLRDGLKRDATAHGPARGGAAGPPAWQRTFGSVPYAAAATVLLGLSLAFSGVLLVENRSLETAASGAAPVRLQQLVTVRGAAASRIEAPRPGEWAVLLVDAGFGDYDTYRATLTRREAGAEAVAAEVDGLVPDFDGFVSVGVPATTLAPGEYELSLEGRAAGGALEPVSRLPFTVTAPE